MKTGNVIIANGQNGSPIIDPTTGKPITTIKELREVQERSFGDAIRDFYRRRGISKTEAEIQADSIALISDFENDLVAKNERPNYIEIINRPWNKIEKNNDRSVSSDILPLMRIQISDNAAIVNNRVTIKTGTVDGQDHTTIRATPLTPRISIVNIDGQYFSKPTPGTYTLFKKVYDRKHDKLVHWPLGLHPDEYKFTSYSGNILPEWKTGEMIVNDSRKKAPFGKGLGTLAKGFVGLQSARDGTLTGLSDMQIQIGDGLRRIPIVGGMLGYGADMITGVVKTGFGAVSQVGKTGIDLTNVVTGGYFDELGNLPEGVDGVEDSTGDRQATGFTKAGGRFASGLVPNYGMYGGGNWGTSNWGNNPDLIMNRLDHASLNHDMDMNEWKWIENTWSTNPSPHQWVGPIGAAYSILGSALFTPAAIYDREVPFLPNYQSNKSTKSGKNK